METHLRQNIEHMEGLAHSMGLDFYPVEFELVPPSFMTEISVYGLPVRMPHWSFGVRYIYQLAQHRMGHSKVFEVVYPGNPGHAYLSNTNTLEENTLVVAHVLGHADFSKNNSLFRRSQEQVGYHIVEQAAAHAHQITEAIETYGMDRVETILDGALALEQHIDLDKGLERPFYPRERQAGSDEPEPDHDDFRSRFQELTDEAPRRPLNRPRLERAPIPPHPERDLLWFIAHYAPDLEEWERDIILAVRRESFYFYPVFACQIMNEGWASYWHARLLRDADFLPSELYLEAAKTHSDVVRPYAGEKQVALAVNPYHVGFTVWERILKEQGMEAAREVMAGEDDFGFIRNHLTEELAHELDLFTYAAERNGEITVQEFDINQVREALLSSKFNFAAPRVEAVATEGDGTLVLHHDYETDGRGLDLPRAQKVLEYVQRIWHRPVRLETQDTRGELRVLVENGVA